MFHRLAKVMGFISEWSHIICVVPWTVIVLTLLIQEKQQSSGFNWIFWGLLEGDVMSFHNKMRLQWHFSFVWSSVTVTQNYLPHLIVNSIKWQYLRKRPSSNYKTNLKNHQNSGCKIKKTCCFYKWGDLMIEEWKQSPTQKKSCCCMLSFSFFCRLYCRLFLYVFATVFHSKGLQ